MIDKIIFAKSIDKVKETRPLIHNITNYVAMNYTANALLAFGASPVMAHAPEEMFDFAQIASALVINIGTLDNLWIRSMEIAAKYANENNRPWILDPVGAGATRYRTETALSLIRKFRPNVIRGNASEIMSLCDIITTSKGVDSYCCSDNAISAAKKLAQKYQTIVVISGATDYITDGQNIETIRNGSEIMPLVTATGCTATSMIGVFLSVCDNPLLASTYAMAIMSIAGEITAEKYTSPGSFATHFIDNLYQLQTNDYIKRLRQ